jgi:hypothetical protein
MQNTNKESAPKHLLVENPYTGKQINILPLLKLTGHANFSGFKKGDYSVYSQIDLALRLLSTTTIEEELIDQVREACESLYEIRDAFGNSVELES